MLKGITYIVRPFMQPVYRPRIVFFSSSGSTLHSRHREGEKARLKGMGWGAHHVAMEALT